MNSTTGRRERERQKRIRRRRFRRRLILCLPPALLVAALCFFLFRSSDSGHLPIPAADLGLPDWITVNLLPINEWSRPGEKLDSVSGVVVHYVGNPGTTAAQNRNYFETLATTHETKASSNFLIGLDGEIILNVPVDEVAYCSNNRNHDTLSIECCHPDETGEFTPETYQSLVRLTAFLRGTYDLSREDILRHFDVTEKRCPLYFVEHPDAWETFLDDVEAFQEAS